MNHQSKQNWQAINRISFNELNLPKTQLLSKLELYNASAFAIKKFMKRNDDLEGDKHVK